MNEVTLVSSPVKYINGAVSVCADKTEKPHGTIAHKIIAAHNSGTPDALRIKFDALCSHDITYVGIIQTARMSGQLREFPVPYVLTNCHNSLCAVGGTINEDDHVFGLSAAKKYGGVFVPAHEAVIHAYMRENYAACGRMILGSDSHTRYGALGTMAVGEGGPELVKQLLSMTYDVPMPEIVAVHLTGRVRHGVGPQDVALALIAATFKNGFVKNRVLEFTGEGVHSLSADFRCGIDVMTTETTCLSSVWETDETIAAYYKNHGREGDYSRLVPDDGAVYDRAVEINLSEIKPMIALPFHPSNAYTIEYFNENAQDLLRAAELEAAQNLGCELHLTNKYKNGAMYVDQGVIAGCAGGTYENLCAAAEILRGRSTGEGAFGLSAYPMSAAVLLGIIDSGAARSLTESGVVLRTAFCGPCFGAGDVPSNGGLSIRHSTRNFPNREGSKPSDRQIAAVALMDARSIAASAANGGKLTGADTLDYSESIPPYTFDPGAYKSRVYNGYGKAEPDENLVFGPGIADWPELKPLSENLILRVASVIKDGVTTTDELIPSGETSSYRSNPYKLSRFTLSRRDPDYVPFCDECASVSRTWEMSGVCDGELSGAIEAFADAGYKLDNKNSALHSVVCANKPGDGSAREQAASCQRVLGGAANITLEYATKRYRSNLINWGMLPFIGDVSDFVRGEYILVPDVCKKVKASDGDFEALVWNGKTLRRITLKMGALTDEERRIILSGCLANSCRE